MTLLFEILLCRARSSSVKWEIPVLLCFTAGHATACEWLMSHALYQTPAYDLPHLHIIADISTPALLQAPSPHRGCIRSAKALIARSQPTKSRRCLTWLVVRLCEACRAVLPIRASMAWAGSQPDALSASLHLLLGSNRPFESSSA